MTTLVHFNKLELGSVMHLRTCDDTLCYIKLTETKCAFISFDGIIDICFDDDVQGFWLTDRTVAYMTTLSTELTNNLIETFRDKL